MISALSKEDQMATRMPFEYRILVNRYGNVNVFRVYDEPVVKRDGQSVRFWAYARTVEAALAACCDAPVTVVREQ